MKFFKIIISALLVLYSFNFFVMDGQAANTTVPANVTPIKDPKNFYLNFDFTDADALGNDTYGKYYKVELPAYGEFWVNSDEIKITVFDKDMKPVIKDDKGNAAYYYYFDEYVEAGTYYIYLESDYNYADVYLQGGFNQIYKEAEKTNNTANDTTKTANDITNYLKENKNEGTIQGAFDKADDVDYYSFTLKDYDLTNVSFYFSNKDVQADSISLMNANGEKVDLRKYEYENDYDDEDSDEISYRLNQELTPGTYFLEVKGAKGTEGKNYFIDLILEESEATPSFAEKESNNDLISATNFTDYLKKYDYYGSLKGSFSKNDQVDYYSFELDNEYKTTHVSFDFSDTTLSKDAISLLDDKGQPVNFKLYSSEETDEEDSELYLQADLPKGKYALKINAPKDIANEEKYVIYFDMSDYSVLPLQEAEPNDELGKATDLNKYLVHTDNSGELKGTTDKEGKADYFKFTVNNELTYVRFSFEGISPKSISLVDSKNQKVNYKINPNKVLYADVPSGEYYLKIDSQKEAEKNYEIYLYMYKVISPVKAEDITVRNIVGTDTITMKNLVVGRNYYIDWPNGDISFKAAKTEQTIKVGQLGKESGKVSIYACEYNDAEHYTECSADTVIEYPAEAALEKTAALTAKDVTIKNNYNTDDVISFTNLVKGAKYTIYTDPALSKASELTSFKATSKTAKITVDQLGAAKGTLYIVAMEQNKDQSATTVVSYSAEQLPALAASNITVKNNNSPTKDSITFKNLAKGMTYKIYKDASKKSLLTSFTADNTSKTVSVSQVGATAGTLYIVVSKEKSDYQDSAATAVKFSGEKLASLAAKNVTIANNIGSDKINLKGLTKGKTYTIYTDAGLKKKLTSFTATGSTKSLSVKLTDKGGAVYVVVTKSGYTASNATKVTYKAQPTAALAAKNVKITNKKKGKDTIKLTGLTKGRTYVIYSNANKKTKLATIKATKSTHSVNVNLNTKGGKVYVTATAPGYSASAVTTVSYKAAK